MFKIRTLMDGIMLQWQTGRQATTQPDNGQKEVDTHLTAHGPYRSKCIRIPPPDGERSLPDCSTQVCLSFSRYRQQSWVTHTSGISPPGSNSARRVRKSEGKSAVDKDASHHCDHYSRQNYSRIYSCTYNMILLRGKFSENAFQSFRNCREDWC
jgi:hypothetical protein